MLDAAGNPQCAQIHRLLRLVYIDHRASALDRRVAYTHTLLYKWRLTLWSAREDPENGERMTTSLVELFNQAQSQLVVQTADLPLGTLAGMVEQGAIDLTPGFQRRERWDPDKQSALIESFLLNVPVPPVYLAEEASGTYTAIDGKQRLRAIADFMSNKLKLRNLERLSAADGLNFDGLPPEIANALKLRPYIRVVTLLKQTHASLKYEVFLRLNRGGELLNNQEIRNVAFRGNMNAAIYKAAESEFLKKQLKIVGPSSAAYKDMTDAESVLRFLTLDNRLETFSGKLAHEMNEFMEEHQSSKSDAVNTIVGKFESAIGFCERLWGDQAFKRPEGDGWRDQMLAGMYDAQMLSVAKLTEDNVQTIAPRKPELLNQTRALFSDPEFEKAVRTGTNTPQRIRYRVEKTLEMLLGLS